MRNPRRLTLDWCADQGYPEAEGSHRHRVLAENKLISQGAPGLNAPMATSRDAAVFLLSTIVSPGIKKAAQAVETFGVFPLVKVQTKPALEGEEAIRLGTPLLDALTECLEQCGSQSELRMVSLQVNRAARPAAQLVLGLFKRDQPSDKPSRTLILTFMPPTSVAAEGRKKPIEHSSRLLGHALTAMADLLAPNIAAANRAFFATRRYDTGPSVPADEPDQVVEAQNVENPSDRRRAPTRKRRTSG
jgi:hypothetical protein